MQRLLASIIFCIYRSEDPLGAIAGLLRVPDGVSHPKDKRRTTSRPRREDICEEVEVEYGDGETQIKTEKSTTSKVASVNHPKNGKMSVEQLNAAWLGNMFGMDWTNWGSTSEKEVAAAKQATGKTAAAEKNLEALARQSSPFS
jgi:hypothetical protein